MAGPLADPGYLLGMKRQISLHITYMEKVSGGERCTDIQTEGEVACYT